MEDLMILSQSVLAAASSGIPSWLLGAIIGAVVGLAVMVTMALGSSTRDTVTFQAPADPLPEVQRWASHFGYEQVSGPPVFRFKKGKGFWTAAKIVELSRNGDWYRIEAFILVNAIVRKRDMKLSGSGWTAKLPRSQALKDVNQLLYNLGQRPLG